MYLYVWCTNGCLVFGIEWFSLNIWVGGTRRLPPVLEFTETLQSNRERGIYIGLYISDQQIFPYLFIVEGFAYFESNCMPCWWYLLQHLASLEAVSVRNPLIIASPAPFGSLWTGHLSFCTNYCRNCYGHPISTIYILYPFFMIVILIVGGWVVVNLK